MSGITYAYLYAVILVLAIFSILTNAVVVIAIIKFKLLHKTSIMLLGVLSGIGLVIGGVTIPANARITLQNEGILDDVFWFMFSSVFLSLGTIMIISIDHLLHIHFLDRYRPSKKEMCIVLLMCWIAPIVFMFVGVVGRTGALLSVVLFSIYIIVIVSAYIIITFILRDHSSLVNSEIRGIYKDSERKVANTLLLIIVSFILFNIPSIMYLATVFQGIQSPKFCIVTLISILLSSIIIPVIYYTRIPVIRDHILKLFRLKRFISEKSQQKGYLCIAKETYV